MIASGMLSCYFDLPWLSEAMGLALEQASLAAKEGEVPVGAIIYWDGEVIGTGRNAREGRKDPLGHAELDAIRMASEKVGDWRLDRALMVVTLEPCPMCMGAMLQARIPLLAYGAADPRAGAAGSLMSMDDDPRFNHTIKVIRGVRGEESARLLRDFFDRKRAGS